VTLSSYIGRHVVGCILVAAALTAAATDAHAFQRRYGAGAQTRQSAGLTVTMPDFGPQGASCAVEDPQGGCEQFFDFTFDHPILGLFYSRPGIQLFIGRGQQGGNGEVGDFELLDTSINVYGAARPFSGERERPLQFVLPYGLHSGYRRISAGGRSVSTDQFEATVIAIGAGAGLMKVEGRTQFNARVMPHFGLASQSLGFGNGTTSLVDADAEVTFGPVKGRFGISIGYAFRWQKWNMSGDFVARRKFEGSQHGLRLGVFW